MWLFSVFEIQKFSFRRRLVVQFYYNIFILNDTDFSEILPVVEKKETLGGFCARMLTRGGFEGPRMLVNNRKLRATSI